MWRTLCDTAEVDHLDLIVIGISEQELKRGVVVEEAFRMLTCPVMFVGCVAVESPSRPFSKLLFLTDLPQTSANALYFLAFADDREAQVIVANVSPSSDWGYPIRDNLSGHKDSDLIIVADYSRMSLTHTLPWSVATTVAAQPHSPVLIAHSFAAQL